jgi:uncharacterized protein (TIGR04222 family)
MFQMNSSELELYQRLQHFEFEQAAAKLSFSQRLAREQNWSPLYTQRVLNEYKKFAFLAVVADHVVTPSEQVDQAWHLHLTYTRSYWQEFCPQILGQPLHHEPTIGGQAEQQKFFVHYNQTLKSYHQFFGHQPPADIWPSAVDRFQPLQQQWLSRAQNWVIPKPALWLALWGDFGRSPMVQPADRFSLKLPQTRAWQVAKLSPQRIWPQWQMIGLLILSCTFLLSGCVTTNSINPLDWTGEEFLAVYIPLSIGCVMAAYLLRYYLRQPHQSKVAVQQITLDPYETAYLSSPEQAVNGAIVSLLEQGLIEINTTSQTIRLKEMPGNAAHPLECKVAQLIQNSPGLLSEVLRLGLQNTQDIQRKLQQMQLLLSERQAKIARLYPALLIGLLMMFGLVRLVVGMSKGRPIGFLMMIGFALLVLSAPLLSMPLHRSGYGDQVWEHLKKKFSADWLQNPSSNYILAYAFIGVTALNSPIFDDFRTVITPPSSGGDGGGDGGGGCGGGCGGCGGCGG